MNAEERKGFENAGAWRDEALDLQAELASTDAAFAAEVQSHKETEHSLARAEESLRLADEMERAIPSPSLLPIRALRDLREAAFDYRSSRRNDHA